VFWLAGITGIIYGLLGGPTNLMGPSMNTVLLGIGLWGVASVWAAITIRSADDDKCEKPAAVYALVLHRKTTKAIPLTRCARRAD
jgi:hypothetical protein